MQRRSVAGDRSTRADLIAVAVEGAEAQRAGVPGPRRRPRRAPRLLPRERGRARRGRGDRGVPRPVLLGGARRFRGWSSWARRCATAPAVIAEALSARRGGTVEVRVAERGDKRRLRELAERNAKLALAQDRLRRERRRAAARRRAVGAAGGARPGALPVRIEGFDISNLGGEHTVASMVVFEGGAPKKSDYRRFKIRRRSRRRGPDDFCLDRGGARAARSRAARAGRPLAARPRARRELRLAARPDPDRRRQGPALGGDAGARAAGRARRRR